jgi:hypothetical protein
MFPCNNCLIKSCCSSYCDKLIEDERVLALYLITYRTCPDCGNHIIEKSPDDMVVLCKKCRKSFTQQLRRRSSEDEILLSSTSSSPSAGSSTSILSKTFVTIGADLYFGEIITNISKYHKVRFPRQWKKEKKNKIEYIEVSGRKEIPHDNIDEKVYRRMSPLYSKTLIKNMDIITKSRLTMSEQTIDKIGKLPEDWIFKHRDLFIKDPRQDNEPEEDTGYFEITI